MAKRARINLNFDLSSEAEAYAYKVLKAKAAKKSASGYVATLIGNSRKRQRRGESPQVSDVTEEDLLEVSEEDIIPADENLRENRETKQSTEKLHDEEMQDTETFNTLFDIYGS